MKKIGFLFGEYSTFAHELIGTLNVKGPEHLVAEPIHLSSIAHSHPLGYDLILNLHPGNTALYQSFLQAEALKGCKILNNPFLFPGFDRYVASVVAENVLLNVVPTHLLPSYEIPPGNTHRSFPNLAYPWGWDKIFEEVGFPAIMKPVQGGEAHQIHKVDSAEEFFQAQRRSGNLPMILQQFVATEEIYLCFYVGNSYQEVMVLPFDPAHGHFKAESSNPHPILSDNLKMHSRAFADELGCDFCALVFAMFEEEPYFIDIHNPIDLVDEHSLGPARFRNLLDAVSEMLIEKADDDSSLSWGSLIPLAVIGEAEENEVIGEILPEKAQEQLLAAEATHKEADSQEFLLVETQEEQEETPTQSIEEKIARSLPEEPAMITYTQEPSEGETEQEPAAQEDKPPHETETTPASERNSHTDESVATHLPPVGIHISDSKQKVMERIASRKHQVNYHRLGRAMESERDDLTQIFGIGPFIEEKLHSLQIFTYRQIANFTEEDERILNDILEFYPGRIERDEWVKQAQELMGS